MKLLFRVFLDCLHMNSLEEIELWCPGQSLWSLIAEHASESELLKIQSALGRSLVNLYTEVHTDVSYLDSALSCFLS